MEWGKLKATLVACQIISAPTTSFQLAETFPPLFFHIQAVPCPPTRKKKGKQGSKYRSPRFNVGSTARKKKRGGSHCQGGIMIFFPIASAKPNPSTKRNGKGDRKSTRLNSSHQIISYAVFCLKKKNKKIRIPTYYLRPTHLSDRPN